MRIESIIFKRKRYSDWEDGIMVSHYDSESGKYNIILIDSQAKIVKQSEDEFFIWDYKKSYDLTINWKGLGGEN